MREKVWLSFSGGKDANYTLFQLQNSSNYEVVGLFTTFNQNQSIVPMHGYPIEFIQKQAKALQLPLKCLPIPEKVSNENYNEIMTNFLSEIKKDRIQKVAFGDILLEDLKDYRTQKMKEVSMIPLFPLWKKNTQTLAREIIASGIKAKIVSVNTQFLTLDFLGMEFNHEFLQQLPKNVDPCGENGEFHTMVYDAPTFSRAINFKIDGVITKVYNYEKVSAEIGYLKINLF